MLLESYAAGKYLYKKFKKAGARTPLSTAKYTDRDYTLGQNKGEAQKIRAGMQKEAAAAPSQFTKIGTAAQKKADMYADDTTEVARSANKYAQGAAQTSRQYGRAAYDMAKSAPAEYGDQAAQQNWGDAAGRLGQTYDTLTQYAQQGPGPSAAQAQLGSALNQNIASQIALARSGRGAGAGAAAGRQAAFTGAAMGQQTAADMATLRAQEEANWRNQQLQAYSQATEAAQAQAGQYGQQFQATAQAQQAARQDKLAAIQGAGALQNQAYDQRMGGLQNLQGSYESAAGIQSQGYGQQLTAASQGQALKADYLGQYYSSLDSEAQRKAQLQGAKMGANVNIAASNQQAQAQRFSAITGMIGSAAGAASG